MFKKSLLFIISSVIVSFSLFSFVGCGESSSVILSEVTLPENATLKLNVTKQNYTHEEIDYTEGMNLDEYREVEFVLYANEGYEFAVTTRNPAKIKIFAGNTENTYNMSHTSSGVHDNTNRAYLAKVTYELKSIPKANIKISFKDTDIYRWKAFSKFVYKEPDRLYRNNFSEVYLKSDYPQLFEENYGIYKNEIYVRFAGTNNFGFGEEEYLLSDFVNLYNQKLANGELENIKFYATDKVAFYAYVKKNMEETNKFYWVGNFYVTDFGNTGYIDYETETERGIEYVASVAQENKYNNEFATQFTFAPKIQIKSGSY